MKIAFVLYCTVLSSILLCCIACRRICRYACGMVLAVLSTFLHELFFTSCLQLGLQLHHDLASKCAQWDPYVVLINSRSP